MKQLNLVILLLFAVILNSCTKEKRPPKTETLTVIFSELEADDPHSIVITSPGEGVVFNSGNQTGNKTYTVPVSLGQKIEGRFTISPNGSLTMMHDEKYVYLSGNSGSTVIEREINPFLIYE